ncbi:FecR domain-containing protein [Methylobacterium sp. W2]|uniref:FecR domain-containing protein n=1 Tax=Methylobacterium sp. W2 TaxID=2598107 RepID=UPI001D0C6BA1|nr:FecR domain-containing protein [Methylobacterium sp. W2]MCC0808215.1 FecR domain-containing protein [Methylobacterium sp. W2]
MTRSSTDRLLIGVRSGLISVPFLVGVVLCLSPVGATAQTKGCNLVDYSDPARSVLTCDDGFILTAEKGAVYTLIDQDRDGRPHAVELKSKALLIEYPARKRGGFQVRTPHAIASVRGTTWIVDTAPTTSAVFVQTGRVRVGRAGEAAGTITLGAGDGVDVGPTDGALVSKPWPRERRLHLLARFGR